MPRRIAIVEDEIAIRRNFEDALRRQGYQVSGYADRKSALAAFSSRLPDMVIIDVGLGDDVEGGFELCRELRVYVAYIADHVPDRQGFRSGCDFRSQAGCR